ncbi:MAG: SDH family Clp fold serine proteinase [Paracoccaceae bacterium]
MTSGGQHLGDADEPFPRGKGLPKQSPLFWVQQKDRYLRQLLIRDIEELSGRRLIVYFANRYHQDADINIGDVSHMAELLGDLEGAPTDLLLNTNGGQTDATEALVSLIQATTNDLRLVVPHSAKSNGTMLCLAATEIVMGPPSELGPIDPYLGPTPTSILAEETVKQQNFALHKLALYAIEQTKSLATRLLSEGMMKHRRPEEIEDTVEKLASRKRFFSHGSAIDHLEAKSLGLNVRYLEIGDPYWDRIWLLYSMYANDMMRDGLLKVFEGRARSMSLSPPPSPTDP